MIHCPGIGAASVVSLANLDGLWTFLQETVHSVAVVAGRLEFRGVEEKEWTR